MERQMLAETGTLSGFASGASTGPATGAVAVRLRGVVYAYIAANIAVVALLLSTVTPSPLVVMAHSGGGQEIASAR